MSVDLSENICDNPNSRRARGGKGLQPRSCRAPPEVRNASWRIFALFFVFGNFAGCFISLFQIFALFWIMPLSTPKNTFLSKIGGPPSGVSEGYFWGVWHYFDLIKTGGKRRQNNFFPSGRTKTK